MNKMIKGIGICVIGLVYSLNVMAGANGLDMKALQTMTEQAQMSQSDFSKLSDKEIDEHLLYAQDALFTLKGSLEKAKEVSENRFEAQLSKFGWSIGGVSYIAYLFIDELSGLNQNPGAMHVTPKPAKAFLYAAIGFLLAGAAGSTIAYFTKDELEAVTEHVNVMESYISKTLENRSLKKQFQQLKQ